MGKKNTKFAKIANKLGQRIPSIIRITILLMLVLSPIAFVAGNFWFSREYAVDELYLNVTPLTESSGIVAKLKFDDGVTFLNNICLIPGKVYIEKSIIDSNFSSFCLTGILLFAGVNTSQGSYNSNGSYSDFSDREICFNSNIQKTASLAPFILSLEERPRGEYITLSLTTDLTDTMVMEVPIDERGSYYFPLDNYQINVKGLMRYTVTKTDNELETKDVYSDVFLVPDQVSVYWQFERLAEQEYYGFFAFKLRRYIDVTSILLLLCAALLLNGINVIREKSFAKAAPLGLANILGAVAIRSLFLPSFPMGGYLLDKFLMGILVQSVLTLLIKSYPYGSKRKPVHKNR